MTTKKIIRRIAKIITLPIINSEKRKEKRQKVENFIHKFLNTEQYRCEQVFNRYYSENKKLNDGSYHLISLGENCFGRMTFSYWGLKPRKADGEKTMPFDISIHPLKTVNSLLETKFKSYFDDIEYDKEKQYWVNPQKNILFVHDLENDRKLFEERYRQRIQNLYEVIEDNKPCLFFCYRDGEVDASDINKLYEILNKLCAHKAFKLVYMVFNAPLPDGINKEIATYQQNYPKGYRHMDKFTKYTSAGLSFEQGVAEFTKKQIQNLLLKQNKKASD